MILHRRAQFLFLFLAVLALVAWVGCAAPEHADGDHDEDAGEHSEHDMTEDEGMSSDAPRVFFVSPADGATVGTLAELQFGAENFTIEPVGDGMVHADHGHFHIGLDTTCLPAGEVIPTADPWVHFGDGSSTIEFSLPPGQHTLTLQVGDGEHRTLAEPGLCTTITVTAEAAASNGA
jgi:hypothetical protein